MKIRYCDEKNVLFALHNFRGASPTSYAPILMAKAATDKDGSGFYVAIGCLPEIHDHPWIKPLYDSFRRAVRETTGRNIRGRTGTFKLHEYRPAA